MAHVSLSASIHSPVLAENTWPSSQSLHAISWITKFNLGSSHTHSWALSLNGALGGHSTHD